MDASGRGGVAADREDRAARRRVDHLDEVLNACDGVMVARGDLGLELPLERVPRVQKDVTRRARARGLPVHRRDAGARVDAHGAASDARGGERRRQRRRRWRGCHHAGRGDGRGRVSRADGPDARRDHPRRGSAARRSAVEVTGASPMHAGHGRAICDAAVTLATRGDAHAIVAITRQGNTARVLSSLRPAAPILAATGSPEVARRLSLHWGVQPFVVAMEGDVGRIAAARRRRARAAAHRRAGTPPWCSVSVSDDLSQRYANYLKLHRGRVERTACRSVRLPPVSPEPAVALRRLCASRLALARRCLRWRSRPPPSAPARPRSSRGTPPAWRCGASSHPPGRGDPDYAHIGNRLFFGVEARRPPRGLHRRPAVRAVRRAAGRRDRARPARSRRRVLPARRPQRQPAAVLCAR